jgi:hypothetical protein
VADEGAGFGRDVAEIVGFINACGDGVDPFRGLSQFSRRSLSSLAAVEIAG